MIIRQQYMQQIRDFIDTPVIKIITGMRRCGKSVLLELTKQELLNRNVTSENIIMINFESLRYERLKDYKALYNAIMDKAEKLFGKIYILLDEIQEVANWEEAINSFRVDLDCDIYITGSNARLLSSELATLLAGRYVEIKIFPLTFKEYLQFAASNPAEAKFSQQEHFRNYLRFGGLPGIHQMKWDSVRIYQYLTDIYNSVLLKDVISRNSIRDTALLERIIVYLMDNIGNTFSAKTISDFLKSQGRKLSIETVYNYLKALESAFLIYKVNRFDLKGKRILETQEKYYLADLGIRHAVLGYRDNDIAGLLENVIYNELTCRGFETNIGKQGVTEIDFIANKRDTRLYLQICYVLTPENTEREFYPLETINDNYEKLVLTTDTLLYINRHGIRQKNIIDFLLDK